MTREPDPRRGMPRSLLYAMIPLGFLLLVVIMVFAGDPSPEPTDPPDTVAQPPDPSTQVGPAPAD